METSTRKKAAKTFCDNWKNRGYEKGDAQIFWTELLQQICGMGGVSQKVKFEYRTATGGFIDAFIPDTGVLIEQKALGVDLDKPEERQGKKVTPFEQALGYAESFPRNHQPRFIVVSNFSDFRVYDRDAHSRNDLSDNHLDFTLEELAESPHLLDFITNPANSRAEKEKRVSMEAGRLVGELHSMLHERYLDPDSPESQHALNVLCVRLVFCLFCEDAGLFPKDAFLDYLRKVEPENMRSALKRLFKALDTPLDRRDPYDEAVKVFPYVNGGLFEGEEEIPNFTLDLKHRLLFDVSQQTDWSKISPTIFGGIFESTLNPETRRAGGMHYTSPENIHKVTDPLFLDELHAEFGRIRNEEGVTPRKRKAALAAFCAKLSNLRFFDPACGSGNFLTESYISLRKLEDDALNALREGQTGFAFDEDGTETAVPRVKLSQFYGIEINDFAVRVAKTALWIAQLQANAETDMLLDIDAVDFPLADSANIVQGNALTTDWNEVLPAGECSFVMGNPPFIGARNQTAEQKAELMAAFHGAKNSGNVDYVAGWYMKAAEYMGEHPIRCGFVSTNSICQGEQVANVWKPIHDLGVHIDFAHDTFRWSNEAAGQAHVFVIIVGFSKRQVQKVLFHHENPDAPGIPHYPKNINAYLADAPDAFVWNRNKPICNVPKIGIGNKPIDGGNYLFTEQEKDEFLETEPQAAPYFHPWLGSEEFIKGKKRCVLWLGDATPAELNGLPQCRKRIEAVREYRLASKSAPTRKLAETPQRFHVENMPEGNSILIPKVSSERRRYIPMGFVGPEAFCSDLVFLIPDATLYHFGVLHSTFHNAWMRTVCGRLKSDYRYSGGVVYNNFVWPETDGMPEVPVEEAVPTETKALIERCAQGVLNARAVYTDSSIADMYDPKNAWMFPELMQAHQELDRAVEAAYGVEFDGDEGKIVTHLFDLYAKIISAADNFGA